MTKVAITCSLVANGGDAAILLGTLRLLESAFGDVKVTVYDLLPEVARRHYPDLEVREAPFRFAQTLPRGPRRFGRIRNMLDEANMRFRWRLACNRIRTGKTQQAEALIGTEAARLLEEYARHDLTVASGGTYLVENYNMNPHLVDLGLAEQLGVPQALLTQSMGPFAIPANQSAMRRLVKETSLTVLRDERSQRHLEMIGLEGPSIRVAADSAFVLAEPEVLKSARNRTWPTDRPPRIGISVRQWSRFKSESPESGMKRYGEAIKAFVEYLVQEQGAEVVFISTCQGNPEYGYDDSKLAAEWLEQLPKDVQSSATVDSEYHRPDDLMEILGSLDLVISTRMHVAILSLCSGTPVIPISYEFKTDELFAGLGVPSWVCDIDGIEASSLKGQFERVLKELPDRRSPLFGAVFSMWESAFTAADLLRETFGGRSVAEQKVLLSSNVEA